MSGLISHLRAAVILLLLALTLVCWAIPTHLPPLLRMVLPSTRWKAFWTGAAERVFAAWMGTIAFSIRLLLGIRWKIRGAENLAADRWYLVNPNHQAWTDIPVLFTVFHGRIPAVKFFLKQELIWVPIIGTACWAFDFPFMKRYSKAYLKSHPEKLGADLQATRKACDRYKFKPVSIVNFAEGSRFTPAKHSRQSSPYRHLLRPRAGGMAFALASMDGKINHLLDVDIVYPGGRKQLWDFIGGRIPEIVVQIRQSRIPDELLRGDYLRDAEFKKRFQDWLNQQWKQKDERLGRLMTENR